MKKKTYIYKKFDEKIGYFSQQIDPQIGLKVIY